MRTFIFTTLSSIFPIILFGQTNIEDCARLNKKGVGLYSASPANIDTAIYYVQSAINCDSSVYYYKSNLLSLYLKKGELKTAETYALKLLGPHLNKEFSFNVILGCIYQKQNNKREAKKYFKKAAAILDYNIRQYNGTSKDINRLSNYILISELQGEHKKIKKELAILAKVHTGDEDIQFLILAKNQAKDAPVNLYAASLLENILWLKE